MYPLPAGYETKTTVLKWRSPSGLSEFRLEDDGGVITASFTVGGAPWKCLVTSNRLRLSETPTVKFDAACEALSPSASQQLKREIEAARPHFVAAYTQFRTTTLEQHGPRLTRCRKNEFGYHGPICVTFWDEGRSMSDQKDKKRNK